MTVLELNKEVSGHLIRTNDEVEAALNRLTVQFRQIDEKYGLMVGKEINKMYDDHIRLLASSDIFLSQSITK